MLLNTPFHIPKNPAGRHVVDQLAAYLDYELPETERAAVREHLRRCPQCENELATLRATKQLLRDQPPVQPPRTFILSAEQAAALREAGVPRQTVVTPPPGRWPRLALGLRLAASAAFVLFLVLTSADLLTNQSATPTQVVSLAGAPLHTAAAATPSGSRAALPPAAAAAATNTTAPAAAAATNTTAPAAGAAAAPTATTAAAVADETPAAPETSVLTTAGGAVPAAIAPTAAAPVPPAPQGPTGEAAGTPAPAPPEPTSSPAAATDAANAASTKSSAELTPGSGGDTFAAQVAPTLGPLEIGPVVTPVPAVPEPQLHLLPWEAGLGLLALVLVLASLFVPRRGD